MCVTIETGEALIEIGLDGIADLSAVNLMSCLSDNGVLASYSRTSRKPMAVHPGNLILKKQTFQGFLPICIGTQDAPYYAVVGRTGGSSAFKEENPVWISEHFVSMTWSDQIDLKIALEGHLT